MVESERERREGRVDKTDVLLCLIQGGQVKELLGELGGVYIDWIIGVKGRRIVRIGQRVRREGSRVVSHNDRVWEVKPESEGSL